MSDDDWTARNTGGLMCDDDFIKVDWKDRAELAEEQLRRLKAEKPECVTCGECFYCCAEKQECPEWNGK